jgi:hypothetical protein
MTKWGEPELGTDLLSKFDSDVTRPIRQPRRREAAFTGISRTVLRLSLLPHPVLLLPVHFSFRVHPNSLPGRNPESGLHKASHDGLEKGMVNQGGVGSHYLDV